MRSHPLVLSVAVATAAVAAVVAVFTGRGPTAPPPLPNVGLAISAPTNGATVGVRRLVVVGTVTPRGATVTINGRAATVRDGTFALPLQLAGPTQTITVVGRAGGYRPATTATTVSYSPVTAAQLTAAQRAATTLPPLGPVTAAQFPVSRAAPPSTSTAGGLPSTVFALPGSAGAGGTGRTGGTGGGGGTSATGSGNGTPVQPVVWTQARIHDWYVRACAGTAGQTARTSFCQCTYRHLARSGAMRSRQSLVALVRTLKPYDRTHNPASLPDYVHLAILDCAQYLPDNNVAARPVIHKLPSLSYPPVPAP
jgi:hypothetical protein